MDFKGKVAVVTGGARGIGKAICRRLSAAGAQIALLDVNLEGAQATAQELSAAGAQARAYACDVSDAAGVEAVVEQILKDFGRIDVLVNNAGITRDQLLIRLADDAWKKVLDVNLSGTFYMTRAVARPMLRARSGAIVNVASVVGLVGNAGQANYSASKAGVTGLTKTAARELGGRGIRVNAVAPGFIDTEMTAALSAEQKKKLTEGLPLGRLGTPEDVAAAVCFLASDDAAYVTGQVLNVCGGMVM
jgi:3-oxoacyl-[acyl-carrier protein] reductase